MEEEKKEKDAEKQDQGGREEQREVEKVIGR